MKLRIVESNGTYRVQKEYECSAYQGVTYDHEFEFKPVCFGLYKQVLVETAKTQYTTVTRWVDLDEDLDVVVFLDDYAHNYDSREDALQAILWKWGVEGEKCLVNAGWRVV